MVRFRVRDQGGALMPTERPSGTLAACPVTPIGSVVQPDLRLGSRHHASSRPRKDVMKLILGALNMIFALATLTCLLGALSGLVILAPFAGGALAMTLVATLALDPPGA